ncbi:hypothetical protein NliqN6_5427 [Naganishia liquefaciens]|uniref:Peptide hydrolase n=1 Tax=Naganishia liquefaciens TaxID=104408 RepID=A0A8H3TY77_9TREE|nr:hypothetical protein NliqN6_5427 [Naganishia liquefaciens]
MKNCLLIPTLAFAAKALAAPTTAGRANDQSILFTTSSGPTADSPACLRNSYHGVYGSVDEPDHVFLSNEECILGNEAAFGDSFRSGSIVPLDNVSRKQVLVWVGEAGVEQHMGLKAAATDSAYESILDNLERLVDQEESLLGDNEQHAFSLPRQFEKPVLYHQSRHSLILGVPENTLAIIDRIVPGHLSLVAIPSRAYPLAFGQDSYGAEVPRYLLDNLANITSSLKYSSKIDQILDALDYREIVRSVRYLTGESGSGIVSRHSFSPGSRIAAKWIREKVETTGAKCTLEPFLPGFAPNVICRYAPSSKATKGPLTILSGHYDSRGSFGRWGAPGADDDASGSAHLLAIAHAIKEAKVTFKREVVLAFFAGEEQGLLGSAAYAKSLYEANATVLLQTQADMLGYHEPSEPLQLAFPATIGTPEAAYLLGNLSRIYSPELVVGTTAACCSDHQSFLPYAFPATQVFERNGPIVDPCYHNICDVSMRVGYDFDQILSIAKVTFAGLLSVAGFEIDE